MSSRKQPPNCPARSDQPGDASPDRVVPARPDLSRNALGRAGEDLAATHLVAAGLEIVERNWRCRLGELDLIALDGDVLVACEVKTRRGLRYGTPAEAVTTRKLMRLRQLAREYVATHDVGTHRVRVDVVGVLAVPGQTVRVTHLRGVS